jgi:chromosome segregation ATPase
LDKAGKQGDELRAQLAQATEQLKASQSRTSQREGQLKQAPSTAALDKAGKQGDELRAQLAQATEQLKASQSRIGQLEGQLKQAPSAAALDDAQKETADLQSKLSATNVIAEGRKLEIEAAKSTPPDTRATAVVARANDETSADVSLLLNRGDSLLGKGDIASGRLFTSAPPRLVMARLRCGSGTLTILPS